MNIHVRFFARAGDLAGTQVVSLTMPDGTTIGEVRRHLARQFPKLSGLLTRSALAIEDEFADDSIVVAPGAEVAVLPPVSGG